MFLFSLYYSSSFLFVLSGYLGVAVHPAVCPSVSYLSLLCLSQLYYTILRFPILIFPTLNIYLFLICSLLFTPSSNHLSSPILIFPTPISPPFKVISGAAPFRGLSNMGAGLHDLMLVPLRDLRLQVVC